MSVRVLDLSGSPIAHATVQIGWPGRPALFISPLLRELPRAWTDADGRCSIRINESGEFVLVVKHPDFASSRGSTFKIPPAGEVTHADIVLSPGARVVGRVRRPDGTADRKAVVSLATFDATGALTSSQSAYTDKDGRFEMRGLAARDHRVQVTSRELAELFTKLRKPMTIVLRAGETKELDL